MRNVLRSVAFLVLAAAPWGASAATPDQRASALLARMTLEDKIGQMVQFSSWGAPKPEHLEGIRKGRVGSLLNVKGAKAVNEVQRVAVEESKMGIPLLFGLDVIHGYKTIFPIPLASSCTWDMELLERAEAVAAREAAAAGIRWTFAPMVDIARDPRWGRIAEGAGEDPYLGSLVAAARVRGFQGRDLSSVESVAACTKHYAAYGAAEAGREYSTTDMSEWTLREVYLPPYRAAVKAGTRSLMSSFNDLNGIPASGSAFLIRRILRGEWAFDGVVLSDWASVKELEQHGYAEDGADAARLGVLAGVDMDMQGNVYGKHLTDLVRAGRVPAALLDEAVRRLLRLKFELGLFDRPYVDEGREASVLMAPGHLDLALEVARRSIVLLKNEDGFLPIGPKAARIAVLGELAESQDDPLGSWSCEGESGKVVSALTGIRSKWPQTRVTFSKGAGPLKPADPREVAAAVKAAKGADAVVVVVGERRDMSGEAASRTDLGLPGGQGDLLKALHQEGIPFVLVLTNGRPLAIPWEAENASAIVESWQLGTRHGDAVADVLSGDFAPEGRLTATFPRNVGQVPLYYAQRNTGRPGSDQKWSSRYIDSPNTPLYPFGYGLTYTKFEYADLRVSPEKARFAGAVTVTATVRNTGDRDGIECVQLYVRDVAGSRTRPVRELKGFRKVALKAGESKEVSFRLTAKDLVFYNPQMRLAAEPGSFRVWVAPNSAEGLEGSFTLGK